jgi:hypothetical protein
MSVVRLLAFGVALSVTTVVSRMAPREDLAELRTSLKAQMQLSDDEWATLDAGKPMVKTLPGSMKREVVTAGGIRIVRAPLAPFVARFTTLEGFRTSQFVKQIAKFSADPRLSDLDPLIIEDDDVDALRRCRPGSCDIQLSLDDIQRFNTEVNWRGPAASAQARDLYKAVLMARVNAYRSGGAPKLAAYHDQKLPVQLAAETRALLDAQPSLLDGEPAFAAYLKEFPARSSPNVADFFYWSKEEFGFRPVVGLNHVSVHTSQDSGSVTIVTIQIYSSHYMDSQLSISRMVPAPGGPDGGFYWLYSNRSRIGSLSGVLGSLARPIVQRRARSGLSRSLLQTKLRTERLY